MKWSRNNVCFLHGHQQCGGRLSREHYISRTVLAGISGKGTVQIGGLPWQPQQTLQKIGIEALVSNVLCETHNAGLSDLDTAAGKLFRAIDAADKRPATLSAVTPVDGTLVERWFLKVLCGLAAAMGFNNGVVPAKWCDLLSGEPWPKDWGLYVPAPIGTTVLATEFYIETLVRPDTKEVKAATFRVAGVYFTLVLGRPDNPAAFGTHYPRGLIFRNQQGEKRVEFAWPFNTDQAVIYTKVGASNAPAPQFGGWKIA